MPFYNYTCKKCGVFEEWQSMSRSSLPMACTSCGKRSKRAISMPNISMVDTYQRIAHQRNEKSADQPEMITKGPKEHGGHSHGHGRHNHGHKHAHSHGPSRPWMIGH